MDTRAPYNWKFFHVTFSADHSNNKIVTETSIKLDIKVNVVPTHFYWMIGKSHGSSRDSGFRMLKKRNSFFQNENGSSKREKSLNHNNEDQ